MLINGFLFCLYSHIKDICVNCECIKYIKKPKTKMSEHSFPRSITMVREGHGWGCICFKTYPLFPQVHVCDKECTTRLPTNTPVVSAAEREISLLLSWTNGSQCVVYFLYTVKHIYSLWWKRALKGQIGTFYFCITVQANGKVLTLRCLFMGFVRLRGGCLWESHGIKIFQMGV